MNLDSPLRLVALGLVCAALPACTLDGFLFSPRPVDSYDFDGVDENLDGELTDPHPSLVDAEHRQEGFVDAAGARIHWVFARNDAPIGTILYSHGTSRHLGRYWDRVELLWQLGFHVLIYDYPGYGRSSGSPSEAGVFASAAAVRDLLVDGELAAAATDNVYFFGYSLGGGPTYELATREGTLRPLGVISEATFCSVEALVQDGSFLDLPGSALAEARFDNCARIGELDRPVLIIHGTEDDFVVPRHAEMLQAAARDEPTVLRVSGAGHSDIPLVDRAGYEDAILQFVEATR